MIRNGLRAFIFASLLAAVLLPSPAGATPVVTTTPTTGLTFDTLRVGTSQTLTLAIHNDSTSSEALGWNSWSVTEPFVVEFFDNGTTCRTIGTTDPEHVLNRIEAGQSCDILVTFAPTKSHRYSGTLELHFGDWATNPQIDVLVITRSLTGRGCKGHGGSGCP